MKTQHTKTGDIGKAGLRREFIAVSAYINKEERFQISNLTWQLKKQEKKQTKPKTSRRKEILKVRAEIN